MLGECLTELAKKYPQSKFVKIISTECIPNYPDKNVPTVLIYKDTQCLQHLIGLAPFGGPRTTPERESNHRRCQDQSYCSAHVCSVKRVAISYISVIALAQRQCQFGLANAEVALSLNRFGPICRQEGEEDTPLSMQDIRVCLVLADNSCSRAATCVHRSSCHDMSFLAIAARHSTGCCT